MNPFPFALHLDKNFKNPKSLNIAVLMQIQEKGITRIYYTTNSRHSQVGVWCPTEFCIIYPYRRGWY